MDVLMNSSFDNEETLPNGIYVRRKKYFAECERYQIETPWISSINIGPWHYSQCGTTREDAIEKIFDYMKRMKQDFKDNIRREEEKIEALNKFLGTESVKYLHEEEKDKRGYLAEGMDQHGKKITIKRLFKKGDKVVCINPHNIFDCIKLKLNQTYAVSEIVVNHGQPHVYLEGHIARFGEWRFIHAE